MAWVKTTGTSQDQIIAGQASDGTVCPGLAYDLNTGGDTPAGMRFRIRQTGGQVSSPPAPSLVMNDGAWHLLAGTFDGASVRLFMDGNEVGSTPTSDTTIAYGDQTGVFGVNGFNGGTGIGCLGAPFTGGLDELRVYDRALTATEIGRLASPTASTPPDLIPDGAITPPRPVTILPPGGGAGNPTARFTLDPSAKMPGGTRFSGVSSSAPLGRRIVDYHWIINGPQTTVDTDCGPSSVMSTPIKATGTYRSRLTVTDSAGATATTQRFVPIHGLKIKPPAGDGIFDCENPAQGNQPSRADCVKSFGFGLLDVNSRGAAGDCFDVSYHDPTGPGKPPLFEGKVAGPVAINGLYVPVPKRVKTIYDSTGAVSVDGASQLPVRIGPFLSKTIPLNFNVTPNKQGVFHLINVDQAVNTPKFLGSLPIRGAFAIDLTRHASKVKVGLGLPSPLSFGGKRAAQGDVYLISDNVKGLHYDGLSVTVPDVWLGPLFVSSLNFHYEKSSDSWGGTAKVTLPGSQIALNASPTETAPDFGFGIKNGKFDHAGFGIDFLPPTQPDLFPPFNSVLLSHVGAAVGLRPLRLTGRIGINAAHVVDEDGTLFAVFATPNEQYTLPEDPGPELAPLANRTFDRFSLTIAGTAKLKVPIFGGELPLLHAYGLYEYPDYFEFGGGFSFGVSFLKLDGSVSGFAYPSSHRFNAQAGLNACLRNIKIGFKFYSVEISPCLSVGGVVSSKGLGFCGVVPVPFPVVGTIPVPIGAGYQWGDKLPKLMPFICDYAPYAERSPLVRSAAAAGYSLDVPGGLPATMFRIRGQGGAPSVTVTDPHGHDALATADALTIGGTEPDTTLVALRHPLAGRWTIKPAPGSVPIADLASANGLPPVGLKARVTGGGRRRVLHYRFTPATGRVVTFVERGPGTDRVLGVARRRAGQISFTPGPGRRGRRSIVALIEQDGTPAHEVTVAKYTAPAPAQPGRPSRVRVTRRRGTIHVTWSRVRGATRYEVLVTLSDHSQVFRVVRRPSVTLADPFTSKRGAVLVDALRIDGARGAARSIRLAAVRSPKRSHK